MTVNEVGGLIRALVAAAGGALVARGVVDGETMATIAGAVATIATALWSVWSKRKA